MATEEIVGAAAHRIFADTFCVLLAFEIRLSKGEVKIDELAQALGGQPLPRRIRNRCNSGSKSTDYHLHLNWHLKEDSVDLTVEFGCGYAKPDPDEEEPFAENFVRWLRQFVLVDKVLAEVYSDFRFPVSPGRQIKFPLPMKAPIGPKGTEAEIDGISFTLTPPTHGVEKVWLTMGEKTISIHMHGERTLCLADFDPHQDVLAISEVLESTFEGKTLEERRQ